MAARRPESVLVVVYTLAGQILIMQRADDPDFWQSVTGSLEDGEAAACAAERELFEETGLHCDTLIDCHTQNSYEIRPEMRHRYAPGVTHNTEHVFLAPFRISHAITLSPTEHLQFRWTEVESALDMMWSPSNRQAVTDFVIPRLH